MHYSNIIEEDIANGQGVRTTLFVSGCKFHCKGCFNSEAWDFNYGKEYTEETEKYILDQIKKPYIKGLSLLGGDPLWQNMDGLKQLRQLVQKVHNLGKTVWIWSGFTYESLLDGSGDGKEADERICLVHDCDVFVDGLFENDLKDLSLAWRGSKNQRVIDVRKTFEHLKVTGKIKVVLYNG